MPTLLTLTPNPALDVSARTPQVRHTRKLRCDTVERHPGGGGINVARVLHRLGADVAACYTSGGTTGQLLTELLADEGLHCLPVAIPGHTRESFTVLEAQTGQEFRFVLPGPELPMSVCDALLAVLAQQRPRWLVASGSLPPGAPPDFYAQAVRQAQAWEGKVVVDSSGQALREALQAGVFLAKPSLREFRELVGQPLASWDSLAQAARQWVAAGAASLLAVSLGEQGAMLCSPEGTWYAPPLPVTVHSAVGAGDSFVAGLVDGLARGGSHRQAFAQAVACGTAALAHQGTGLARADDVQRLLPEVRCLDTGPDQLA